MYKSNFLALHIKAEVSRRKINWIASEILLTNHTIIHAIHRQSIKRTALSRLDCSIYLSLQSLDDRSPIFEAPFSNYIFLFISFQHIFSKS